MQTNWLVNTPFVRCTHEKLPVFDVGDEIEVNGKKCVVKSNSNNHYNLEGPHRYLRQSSEFHYEVNGMVSVEMVVCKRFEFTFQRYVTVYGKNDKGEVVVKSRGWFGE